MIFKGYCFGILYGLLCLLIALVTYKLGVPKKYTRKIVHILVGFEWVILYHYLGATYHFLLVCIFFLLLLVVAHFGKLMPMISSEGENSPGTVYYAVAMTGIATVGLFLPEVMLPFGIGIMCTSVGDGVAGVVGQLITKHNPKIYKIKSLYGSIANLLASFASALLLSNLYGMELSVLDCASLAVLSVGLEIVVGFGLDNIAVTWGVTALGYLLMYVDGVENYLVPIIVTPLIIAFVIEKRALTPWGVVGAVIVDLIISLALGNFGFIMLITFFVSSVIVDKIKKLTKNQGKSEETAKGDRRDAIQVLANALVPCACACAFVFSHGNPIFVVGFVAAISEAFADTVASGIGAFSNKAFDPFRWRVCENGLSGGMSLIGTLASLLAAFLIAALAMPLTSMAFSVEYFLVAASATFLGAVFDSLLGSLLQVKFKCPVCGKLTEKRLHCDTPTEKVQGISFIDNDVVNALGGVFSAFVSILFVLLVF